MNTHRAVTAPAGPAARNVRTGAPQSRTTAVPADPVRELMHRHRELCERAVDPLEIAAGLEAYGVTDRTAARFRHRDVFALAEELFARVPRADGNGMGTAPDHLADASHARWSGGPCRARVRTSRAVLGVLLLPLLPGLLCATALGLFELAQVRRAGVPVTIPLGVAAAIAVGAAVRLVLRRVVSAVPTVLLTLATCWLTGCALFGDALLDALLGGPDGSGVRAAGAARAGTATVLSLACAVAPAAWCARWFAARARLRLKRSRSLDEFAARTRPLVAAAVALFIAALLGLQFAVGAVARSGAPLPVGTALGVLLFTALLLTAHGFGGAAGIGLGAACAMEALALVAALAVRLPGAGAYERPVHAALTAV
ncbi:MAG: hypothetical protein ACRDP3_13545, partial [Streptomyces sp.]|uniref:hypothetical protein n=1 Tax=Streptomyces sp. TaxID=1931 RepID=UPI003D6B32E1